jgi:predicted RNase H-like HicB family nuclease
MTQSNGAAASETARLESGRRPCYTGPVSLSSYIDAALASARFKTLEDKTFFGDIPRFKGVWASAKTAKRCRESLREVLEDWIVLKLRGGEALPAVNGKRLTIPALTRA